MGEHLSLKGLMKFKQTVRVDADYFPEIIGRVFIIRTPWIFSKIWAIVKHFFDEGTREKIQIVANSDTYKVLSQHIDKKWIPEDLGGDMRVGSGPLCEPLICNGGPVPRKLIDDIIKSCWDKT